MEQFIQEKRALAEKKLNELNIDDYLKEDADGFLWKITTS